MHIFIVMTGVQVAFKLASPESAVFAGWRPESTQRDCSCDFRLLSRSEDFLRTKSKAKYSRPAWHS